MKSAVCGYQGGEHPAKLVEDPFPPPKAPEVPIEDPNPVSREFECVRHFYGYGDYTTK